MAGAVPTNTYETYDAIGIREDISDLIFNISPVETPGLSMAGVTTATQTLHNWQKDTLDDPVVGAQDITNTGGTIAPQGDDPALTAAVPTTMLGNTTQINTRAFSVSGTLEVAAKYGRDGELSYQAAKTARFLKNVVDQTITGVNQGTSAADETGEIMLSASLEAWLETNVSLGASPGANGGSASMSSVTARTDGVVRAFTQAQLDSVIQSAWTNGGKPTVILCGPTQKTNLSGFDGVGTAGASGVTRSDRASRTIYATADTYYSNFGILNVVPSRHVRLSAGTGGVEGAAIEDRNVFCLDPEYLKVAYLRSWQQWDLAKSGDSIKRQMLAEWTLEVCNEAAHALVADVGTAS